MTCDLALRTKHAVRSLIQSFPVTSKERTELLPRTERGNACAVESGMFGVSSESDLSINTTWKSQLQPTDKTHPLLFCPLWCPNWHLETNTWIFLSLRSFITGVVKNLGGHIMRIVISTLRAVNLQSLSQFQPDLSRSMFVNCGFIQVLWGGIEESECYHAARRTPLWESEVGCSAYRNSCPW